MQRGLRQLVDTVGGGGENVRWQSWCLGAAHLLAVGMPIRFILLQLTCISSRGCTDRG